MTIHPSYLLEIFIRHHVQIVAGTLRLGMSLVVIASEWFERRLDRFESSDHEATLVCHLEVVSLLIVVVLDINKWLRCHPSITTFSIKGMSLKVMGALQLIVIILKDVHGLGSVMILGALHHPVLKWIATSGIVWSQEAVVSALLSAEWRYLMLAR